MGQFKKAIFIGRDSPDNGLSEYRKIKGVKLDEYINVPNAAKFLSKYDIAFVSRYLAILEALAAGVPVIAHYNNAIKKDYLQTAPFAKYIQIFKNPKRAKFNFKFVGEGQRWAKTQTWDKIADMYEKLWQR